MKIYVGTDHAGFELKNAVVEHLTAAGHDVTDCGAHGYDAADDYPPFILAAAAGVAGDPGSLGVVIGGSGNGEAIAANKVDGVRCALAFSDDTASLAREHNDANVISLGARQYDQATALRFVDLFVGTPFSEDPRHVRRIAMITEYEKTSVLPQA